MKNVLLYSRISKLYGESCMNLAKFYKWVEQIENGRDSVTGENGSGRPPHHLSGEVQKPSVSRGKVMLTMFWEVEGPAFVIISKISVQ